MNLAQSRSLHPHLRDEEALVVENAIRLAIDSIVNVLYGVNSARTREYQRMVADRDKEIQRLECRLTEIEDELQALRRHGCTCRLFGDEHGPGTSRSSGDRHTGGEQLGFDTGGTDNEMMAAGQQECEMSISLGFFARPASSQSHESVLPSSPSRMGLDQTSSTSRSSDASCVAEAVRNMPPSPSGFMVKEEPCDMDLIKWEMSEERAAEHQDNGAGGGSPRQDREGPSAKKTPGNREGTRLMENPQVDPLRFIMADEHLRNKRKSVPMSQLPEEAQRLKRAAWRAASRRYYARKIARQKVNPSRPDQFLHITNAPFSQHGSLVDGSRRTLMSDLPEESQSLQREPWRGAATAFKSRKIGHHQTETQYGHLFENMNPSGDMQAASRKAANSGGILCS